MKKIFLAFLLTFSIFTFTFAEEHIVSASVGLSSGVPFYGSQEVKDVHTSLEKGSRVILGGLFSLNLNPIKEVTFFAGTDFLCDFNNMKPYAANLLSFDVPFGIKLYPGIAGLNVGVAYAFGFRSDYYNLEETGKYNSKTYWGNGFKFLAEYNFAHDGSSIFLPTIGMYWKHMPRGENNFDNQICAYVCANF